MVELTHDSVQVERIFSAPRATVWAKLTDHVGWSDWAGMGSVELECEGKPHRDGTGAIRVIRNMGIRIREEVVSWDPESSMEYRVLSGIPLRQHLGRVEFADVDGDKTRVVWSCQFQTITGFNGLARVVVKGAFSGALKQLSKHLDA